MSSQNRLEAERDEYLEIAQRTKADFDNFRKRMERERGADELRGRSQVVREMLPALDALYLALDGLEDTNSSFAQGILLVVREFEGALERMGIETYDPLGEIFDPQVQEVVSTVQTESESGIVLETIERGYRIEEIIIRPARVVVAE